MMTLCICAHGQTVVTPYAAWEQANFTQADIIAGRAAENAAVSGDPTPNLLRYALGLSVGQLTTGLLPQATVSSDGHLQLSFQQPAAVTDVSYTVQVSSDLTTWNSGPNYTQQASVSTLSASLNQVTVRDLSLTANNPRRFMRLFISRINFDTNNNGLSDDWELKYFGQMGVDPQADPDGDGLTNLQEYLLGNNPNDYYNGRALVVVSPLTSGSSVSYNYDQSGRLLWANYGGIAKAQFAFDAASNLRTASSATAGIVAWRAANSLPIDGSGDGADSVILVGDGLPNLAKYGFGLMARTAYTGDYSPVTLLTVGGSSYLMLTYQRPEPALSDLIYKVEVSADGTTWASGAGATVDVSTRIANGIATVSVRDATAVSLPSYGRRIRLNIERRAVQ